MTLVVGFYSIGTTYEQEAELLRASLDKVGMEHRITGFADRGSWYANTAEKAGLIRQARYDLSGPMLYVDVDAFVRENCTAYFDGLAAEGYDFGAHYFAGPAKGRVRMRRPIAGGNVCVCLLGGKCDGSTHRLLSGTLFFGDTKGARKLCDNWVKLNATLGEMDIMQGGGQKNLWYLTTCMEQPKGSLRVARIPGRYTYVFDKPDGYPRNEPKIIVHSIASRENRGEVRHNASRQRQIAEWRRELGI